MKIKLDENLPRRLQGALAELGHDVDTAVAEGLGGMDDGVVWAATQRAGRFLITQDLDFSDIKRFMPGSHHGMLLVRLRDPGREALLQHILSAFTRGEADVWDGCFVVLTEHRIRIRKPNRQ